MSEATASPCLTFDTDWVPPFVLDEVLAPVVERGLKATVFCTARYTLPQGVEAALHPNLMPDSTQGGDPEAVMRQLLEDIPGARGVRTHRMFWHGGLFGLFSRHGLTYDSSVLLPFQPNLQPNLHKGLLRLPVWWSEAAHMGRGLPMDRFDLPGLDEPGLKVLLFHPIHIYLNSPDPLETRKTVRQIGDLSRATRDDLEPHRNTATVGMKDLFLSALARLEQAEEKHPGSVRTLDEVARNA